MDVVSSCREELGYVPQQPQPSYLVATIQLGTLGRLPALSRRKVGTTSSHHDPYVQGHTRATMGGTKGREPARGSQSQKAALSSDWSLQLDSMKLESLVIADQHAAVNTLAGIVHSTRPKMRAMCTGSDSCNLAGRQPPMV